MELALIIDPQLIYSTFLSQGYPRSIAVDDEGNVYIAGITEDDNYPITEGAYQTDLIVGRTYYAWYDIYVTKLNSTGTELIYSTFIGGEEGNEELFDMALDGNGSVYLTGMTYSQDYPVTDGAYKTIFNDPGDTYTIEMANCDAYITKLDPTGSSLIYSTFIGGRNVDFGFGIDVDKDGFVYVAGITQSDDFPTTSGTIEENPPFQYGYNSFISKLNQSGTGLIYSTYGDTGSYITDIKVDDNGHTFLSYNLSSTEMFIAKLNESASQFIFNKRIGYGNSYGIAIDGDGNSYITGATNNWPDRLLETTENAFQPTSGRVEGDLYYSDAFLVKVDAAGSNILYSTFIAGRYDDIGYDVVVEDNGIAYVMGKTRSENFPVKNAFQPEHWR